MAVERALISVFDKTGIVEFAKRLAALKIEILSTGGTSKLLREAGVSVRDVSDFTGWPEMLGGRVKTLHPKVHGGILARRDLPEHMAALEKHDIPTIDLLVVNLYPFVQTVSKEECSLEDAIENIDIGGPTMLRSAAKNHRDVTVIVDGWHGDTSRMFYVGKVGIKAQRLVDITYDAMMRGIESVKPGAHLGDIGQAIQTFAENAGFSVVRADQVFYTLNGSVALASARKRALRAA